MTSFSPAIPFICTLGFTGLITLLSLMPGSSGHSDSPVSWLATKTPAPMQKLLHVCFYAVLALLLVWTLGSIQTWTYRLLIAFIIAVAFGAVMEWCQTMVPGRHGTVFDVALNAAGAALGLLAAILWIQT